MMNILVVAAHPDDEVLGCGGTIARLSHENIISTLILGEGITSRDIPKLEKKQELSALRESCKKANTLLGVKKIYFEKLPDNKFDSIPLLNIIKPLEDQIKKIQPDIIFTHHSGDLNIDHRLTQQAVLTATRPFGDNPVKKILSFEVLSSTEWNIQDAKTIFTPNIWMNISGTIHTKLDAMAAYSGELCDYPHPRSIEGIKILAAKRGLEVGFPYAEAFSLIRSIE
jgi:LmbE family N-acetylglucosaminyl deacetylase